MKKTYPFNNSYTQNMTASAYVFEYCAHVSFDAVNGPSCEMEVGGVKCNSCAVAVNGGATYDENCEIFDCTNTKIEFAGDRCDAIATPTLLIEAEFNYLYQGERNVLADKEKSCAASNACRMASLDCFADGVICILSRYLVYRTLAL